jgi:precorrin-3B synthase
VGIGLPFGQVEAVTLAALARAGEACGGAAFAPAEGRTLLALGLPQADVAPFRDRAAELGFITRADDPRRAVIACPGAPACAAGLMPARAVAEEIAAAAAPILDGSVTIHISGCAKGCAHPRAATLTFTGDGRGANLVVAGRAGDDAVATVPAGGLPAAVARLAAAVNGSRRPGEPAADAIARLGPRGIAAALLHETADA